MTDATPVDPASEPSSPSSAPLGACADHLVEKGVVVAALTLYDGYAVCGNCALERHKGQQDMAREYGRMSR